MEFGYKFDQGSPCFRPWVPLGLVHFVGFGGVSGCGGVLEEAVAWLIIIGAEEWLF